MNREYTPLSDQQLEERFYPLASERLVTNEPHPITTPDKHLSALGALAALTAVNDSRAIGENGPSNAANARYEQADNQQLNLYNAFFPRDAHVVAKFLEDRYPELLRATIVASLEHLGKTDLLGINGSEQEIGKVPHEIRDGTIDSIAKKLTKEKGWQWPYYGAVDTTVKNASAVTRLALKRSEFLDETYTDHDGETHTISEGLAANLAWIQRRMDMNPEGLVESLAVNPKHHANQTWADSPDAFHHADGTWARHYYPEKLWGVASVELQAEVYDTLMNAADLYEQRAGSARVATVNDLRQRASKLKGVIFRNFWVEDHGLTHMTDNKETPLGGYFARGTDRDEAGRLHPLKIRTSDMGQLLDTRLLDGEDAKVTACIEHLYSSEMLSRWGIRTLATDSIRYFEDRYHNGNTWPWVSFTIARGLDRHGYHGLARDLKIRVWNLYDKTHMMPEFAPGSNRPLITNRIIVDDPTLTTEAEHPISQPAQEIQAWTVAALVAIKLESGAELHNKLYPRRPAHPVLPKTAIDPAKRALEVRLLRETTQNDT